MARKPQIQTVDGSIPVTIARAAQLCSVTEKTLRSWISNGMPVLKLGRQGSNKDRTIVDLVEVLKWYLEQDALDVAKTRLASAQADRHEMENALRRGELALVQEVEDHVAELVLACRAKLLAMPMKLAAQLTNVADPNLIATRIRTDINIALSELATGTGMERSRGSERGDRQRALEVQASAGSDGEPVGRRRKKA